MKIDVYREHRDEYAAKSEPTLVTVGPGRYLTVSGRGAPAGTEFREKVAALYGIAYTIKFACKRASGRDFKVSALEGLWSDIPGRTPRSEWRWKLLVRVPDFVTPEDVEAARIELKKKARTAPGVRLETLEEGPAVQALHVGPYAAEPATLARMKEFARARGLRFRGRHHEIYLSDPRRVAPGRMRTILRHAVGARPSRATTIAAR